MIGDASHARLLSSGWRWQDATSYHRDLDGLSLALTPLAQPPDDAPTQERFYTLRRGPWLLRRDATPLAHFDSFISAAAAVLLADPFTA